MGDSFGELAAKLNELRRRFDPAAAATRFALLSRIDRARCESPAELAALHEELMFLSAYPSDRTVLSACARGLRRIAQCVHSGRFDEALRNSGISGTRLCATFSSELLRWLDDRFRSAVRLAWDEPAGTGAEDLLSLLAAPAELDGLQRDDISSREWLRAARGPQRELQWLTARLAAVSETVSVRDALLEKSELPIEWPRLPYSVSRTGLRFPPRTPFFHADLHRDAPQQLLSKALPRPVRLSRAARRRLIDTARLTLTVRERETDPVTYANERETTLFRLERGIDVALFGMQPEHRLPIESYFGFVAAKNRVPIAYGGGWVFQERCEIGVNLFETFRGGESTLIFTQVMRVYHHYYRVRRFTVAPYQFGAENDEAIRSGAFWFYYRLGFRPQSTALRELAQREARRIAENKDYRTSAATLRRFTHAPLELWIDRPRDTRSRPSHIDLARVSFAVSRWIGRECRGDAGMAFRIALRRWSVIRDVKSRDLNSALLTRSQQALLLLLGVLPGVEAWPAGDRAAFARLLQSKRGPCERTYALAVQRHAPLRDALARLSRSR